MMKKINILFVYGYKDDPDSKLFKDLKKVLNSRKFNVISDYYAQYSPKEALIDLNNYVKEYKIDIVIGIELGGWLCTLLNNKKIKKILINPTFNPLVEFDNKENGFPEHISKFYKEYIDNLEIENYNYSNTTILLTNKTTNEYDEIDSNNIVYINEDDVEFVDIVKKYICPLLK